MSFQAPQLATQLQLIQHANPLLRRQAVFGCFQLLKAAPGINAAAALSTIQECLSQPYLEVAQECVTQLPQLAALQRQGLEAAVLVQLLLETLPSASSLTAPHLAAGLLQLLPYQYPAAPPQAAAATAAAGSAGYGLPGWAQHPLSVALQCQPGVAPALLAGSCKLLATAAAGAGSHKSTGSQQVQLGLPAAWHLLQPFFSFVLLGYSCASSSHRGSRSAHTAAAGAGAASARGSAEDTSDASAAAGTLVWHLVRLASSSEQVAALVTPFLVTHLLARPRGTLHDRQLLVNTCVDLVDLLEAHQPETARGSTAASSNTNAASGSYSRSPPGDWWAVSCQQVGQLLLQVALDPCSGGSNSNSDSAASDTGSCLLQLQRLLVLEPGALPLSCCPALGCLLLALEGPQEQQQVLQLLAALIGPQQQQQQSTKGPQQQVLSPWDAGLLVLPLLQCVALSTTPAVKAWASRVLAAAAEHLQQQRPGQQQVLAAASPQGVWGSCEELCAIASAQQLLASLWTHPCSDATGDTSAVAWCCSLMWQLQYLQQQVKHSKAAAAGPFSVPLASAKEVRASEAAGGGLVGAGAPLGLAGGVVAMAACWVMSALLTHPSHLVVQAAAAATQQLLLVHPPAGVPFVPLLLWRLRRVMRQQGLDAARSAQALLGVLPALCYDPTVAAMVQRALTPLTAPATTQPLLSATSLQLTVGAWQVTGRGWSRAETAINGCLKPGAAKDAAGWGRKGQADAQLPLRLMRAKSLRDAAAGGSGRVLDCICCLQDCLADPRPAVAALAMEAVSALTKEDTLDFYTVWQVVNQCLPPEKVLAATAGSGTVKVDPGAVELAVHMVDLLGCAVLDARLYADRAAAILELLWSVAVQHANPKVRAAALRSLAAFPLDLLESLELLPPLQDYVQPLLREAAAMDALLSSSMAPQQQQQQQAAVADQQLAMEAAEQLSLLAVNQEFDQRRVFMAAAAASGAAGGSSQGRAAAAEGSTRELLQVRHRLLRSLPLALTTLGTAERGGAAAADAAAPAVGPLLLLWQPKASSGAAAADGAALWQAVFEDVAARAGGLGWVEPGVWAAAWQAFMTRWQLSTARPAEALLSQLRGLWQHGTPGEAVAACGAAAGLAAAGQLGEAQLSEVVKDMLALVKRPRATPVAVAAAAALARLAAALHPSDWTSRRTILGALQQLLLTSTQPTAAEMADEEEEEEGAEAGGTLSSSRVALAAAAVEGLGHLGVGVVAQYVEEGYAGVGAPRVQLAGVAAEQLPEALQLSCSAFKLLLTCLQSAQPAAAASAVQQQVLPQLPVGLGGSSESRNSGSSSFWASDVQQDVLEAAQLYRRLWQSNLSMAHALSTVTQSPTLVTPLVTLVTQQWQQAAANPAAAAKAPVLLAAVGALPQAAAVGVAQDVLQPSELVTMLTGVTQLVTKAAEACNYQVAAAAAAASGQLLAVALPHGGIDQSMVQQVVDQLTSLAAGLVLGSGQESSAAVPAAVRLAAVAGLGAAVGVDPWSGTSGCLTGDTSDARADTFTIAAGSVLPTTSLSSTSAAAPPHLSAAKAILRQLEALAAVARKGKAVTGGNSQTVDQRVKGAAAWMLAAVCHTLAVAAGGGPAAAVAAAAGGVSAHSRGGRHGSSSAEGAAVLPLSVYPAAGVLRPLAERLLAPSSCMPGAVGEEASASLALGVSITRVLAQGPRLPAADWLPLCRRLLQPTTFTAAAAGGSGGGDSTHQQQQQQLQLQLQQAVLQLVLSHCTTPALGLSGVLDWLLSPARFQQAHVSLQVVLLQQLLVVLRVLPVNRGPALLAGLAGMVQSAAAAAAELSGASHAATAGAAGGAAGSAAAEGGGRQVWVAAWQGVAALCQAAGAKEVPFKDNKSLVEAVHGTVFDLVNQLPVLPVLPPGFLLHLLQPGARAPPIAGPRGDLLRHAAADSSIAATGDVLAVWAAAVECLSRLRPELLLKVTPLQPAPLLDTLQAAAATGAGAADGNSVLQGATDLAAAFLRSCQLRGLLVARQALSWREVAEAWPLLLQLPVEWLQGKTTTNSMSSGSSSSSSLFVLTHQQWDALLPCIAAAACCLPQTAQVQLLQEFGATAAVCGSAGAAVLLLAALAAAWASPPPGLQSSTLLALGDQLLTRCWGQLTQGAAPALRALPVNLVHLLRGPRWQGAAESVCQVLLQLQQVAWRNSHQQQQQQQPGVMVEVGDSLSAAIVSVARSCLPGQVAAGGVWEAVSAQLCS